MIVSSSTGFFFRISRAWQFRNSSVLLNSTHPFQRYHYHHGLSNINERRRLKGLNCFMGWNKKRKTGNPAWRPINTQLTSNKAQDDSVESIMAEPGYTSNDQDIGLKDAEGVLGDCMSASTSQSRSEVTNEKQTLSMEVGASVMCFIRGKDGSVQKGIEDEMGVRLIIPVSKKNDFIVVEGDSMDVVTKATEKIQAIIDEAVKSPALEYSHFISLPLAIHCELVDKLTWFQSTVLGDCHSKDAEGKIDVDSTIKSSKDQETKNCLGIEKSIFNKPKTFHLTVLMLKLWNKERVQAAKGVLQSVTSEIIEVLDNRPLFVRLKGLACMKGSPAKAQVLYLPVEEVGNEGRLLSACQLIIDAYVKAGLVLEKDTQHKLKFHATVMNTVHRKGRRSKRFKKDTFDARGIFERFGSEFWGDYHIREAHLSKRFMYDENGYYHCCASIPFPEVSEVPESESKK